ncbi:MAG TPA: O-antigen ligase family protein [Gaiellaceae bacterium]|nr:O-antigen ligase family protein [Gaiellaceae bacterium]
MTASALALLVYLPALAAALVVVWRRPVLALYAFVVGLALHNLVMALLFGAGVDGLALDAIQAWKELLLAAALARVATDAVRARRLPVRPGLVDALALAFGAVVAVYALVPQDPLGGEAGANAILLSARHALTPVAAYLLGRSLALGREELFRIAWTVLATAAAVAAIGLVEEYTVSVEAWRDAGVPAYFRDELGFEYKGPARMPENFAFNSGDGELHRRLVSTFVSPLASAFLFAVALLLAAAGGLLRAPGGAVLGAVTFVGLLFTISRSTVLALAGGLVVLAAVQRRWLPAAAAVGVVAAGLLFTLSFERFAPETHFLPSELAEQARIARERGDVEGGATSLDEPSIRSHLDSLREGLRTVAEHPQGYGLGNAGAVARREDVELRAGESNYTEIGVETGVLGLALFLAWSLALFAALARAGRGDWAAAGVAASLATVLALAVQTDAYGIPWLGFCLWWLGGALSVPLAARARAPARAGTPAVSRAAPR